MRGIHRTRPPCAVGPSHQSAQGRSRASNSTPSHQEPAHLDFPSPQPDSIAQPVVGEPSYHAPPPRQTLLPALVAHAHISLSHLVKVGGQTAEFADGPGGKMKRCASGSHRGFGNGPSEFESESESAERLAVAPFAFVERIRRSAPHHSRGADYGCSASCTTVEEFSSQEYSGYSIYLPAAACRGSSVSTVYSSAMLRSTWSKARSASPRPHKPFPPSSASQQRNACRCNMRQRRSGAQRTIFTTVRCRPGTDPIYSLIMRL